MALRPGHPETQSAAARSTTPRPSLRTRLWFAWFACVALCVTVPMSVAQVVGHQFRPTARNFKRWSGRWARAILWATGIRVEVEEVKPLEAEAPFLFVANHQNTVDILALAAGLPYPFGFVAKQELADVPMLGFALRNSASIFIDRSDPRRSLASMQEAGRRIRAGNSVLVFPEGARSYGPALLPLKKGAFVLAIEAGVPLVPVVLLDAYRLMDERVWAGRPGTVHLIVGRPLSTAGCRRRDVPALIDAARAQMEALLAGEGSEGRGTRLDSPRLDSPHGEEVA